MSAPFCIIGATRGTGLLIAQQLLERGSNVKVVVRDPGKASQLLGNRADVRQGDVIDARSIRDAIAGTTGQYFSLLLLQVEWMVAPCSGRRPRSAR